MPTVLDQNTLINDFRARPHCRHGPICVTRPVPFSRRSVDLDDPSPVFAESREPRRLVLLALCPEKFRMTIAQLGHDARQLESNQVLALEEVIQVTRREHELAGQVLHAPPSVESSRRPAVPASIGKPRTCIGELEGVSDELTNRIGPPWRGQRIKRLSQPVAAAEDGSALHAGAQDFDRSAWRHRRRAMQLIAGDQYLPASAPGDVRAPPGNTRSKACDRDRRERRRGIETWPCVPGSTGSSCETPLTRARQKMTCASSTAIFSRPCDSVGPTSCLRRKSSKGWAPRQSTSRAARHY